MASRSAMASHLGMASHSAMASRWIFVQALMTFCPGSRSSCICNMRLRSVCLGPSDLVFVPCPALDSERFSLSLFQNHTRLATWTNQSASSPASRPASSPAPAVTLTNHSSGLGFTLTVSHQSGSGPYVCEAQRKYPPPVRTRSGPEAVMVLIRGRQCDLPAARGPDVVPVSLMWAVSVACLSIYSLVCSAVCVSLWIKVKSRCPEADIIYVNTKAPPTNKPRRKLKEIHVLT